MVVERVEGGVGGGGCGRVWETVVVGGVGGREEADEREVGRWVSDRWVIGGWRVEV